MKSLKAAFLASFTYFYSLNRSFVFVTKSEIFLKVPNLSH